MKNLSFFSSILLTCKSVWQKTFSGRTFFQLFPQIWNQRKILHIELNKFWGHWVHIWVFIRTSRMQIRKKCLNQLKNFFNKHFWEYYLASFCWWISSSCENHCYLVYSVYKSQVTPSLSSSHLDAICMAYAICTLCVVWSLRLTTLEFWVMDDVILLYQKQSLQLSKEDFSG